MATYKRGVRKKEKFQAATENAKRPKTYIEAISDGGGKRLS
ncbi:MAG: hypothetical protein ACREBS_11860 [Nitrososphaerales archaeon]